MEKLLQYSRDFTIAGEKTSGSTTIVSFTGDDYTPYTKAYFDYKEEFFKVTSKITNTEFVKLLGNRLFVDVEIKIVNTTVLAQAKALTDLITANSNPSNRDELGEYYMNLSIELPLGDDSDFNPKLDNFYMTEMSTEDFSEDLMIGETATFSFKRKILNDTIPTTVLNILGSGTADFVDSSGNYLLIGV